jgi:hypothetical protein
MNQLDILTARIERGYRLSKDPEKRPVLRSARELVEAAAVTGQGVTLNAAQAQALHAWLDYHAAAQELGLRDVATSRMTEEPTNIVRFPMSDGSRVTSHE